MNVLVVSEYFYPRLAGGEIALWQLCTALSQKGHKIHVVTSRMNNTSEYEVKEGMYIYRPFPSGRSLLARTIFMLKLYLYLRRFLKLRKVDIVYNLAYIPTLPATYLASKYGIRAVTSVHSLVGRDWFRLTNPALAAVNYLMEIFILRFGRHSVMQFPSEDARKRAPHGSSAKSMVIANPVETTLVKHIKAGTDPQTIRQRLDIDSGELFLLFVGSLLPVKNVPGLIATLSRLVVQFKLVIVGEGPDREKIEKLVRKLGLEEKVKMLGHKSHEDTLRMMASCDALILPSRSEVFPMVVLETLALGRPVIATKVGGISDIVSKNLYVIDSLEQINEVVSSGIKPHAEEEFAQRFAPDKIASEFESLFEVVRENADWHAHIFTR